MFNKMNEIENINAKDSLFIICPFCQLETFLRTKFGEDIFFMTATAGVLNFCSDEISAVKGCVKREKIKNIYLVNDVGCNFIAEAIKNEDGFGLNAERQLRNLLHTIRSKVNSVLSLEEKKKVVAENNAHEQAEYLASEKIFKHEVTTLEIIIHKLIINKREKDNHTVKLN
jgi:hypothetical protein